VCALPDSDAPCRATCGGNGACGVAPSGLCPDVCLEESSHTSPVGQADQAATSASRACVASTQTCAAGNQFLLCEAPGLCNAAGTACESGACVNDLDCVRGYYCDPAGVCQLQLNLDMPCARGLQCVTSFCDGGACADCVTDADCPGGKPRCVSGHCDPDQFVCDAQLCTDLGLGAACNSTTGGCECNPSIVPLECNGPRAPTCLLASKSCGCGALPACGRSEVCAIPAGAPLGSSQQCRAVAGRPCASDDLCASGQCVGNVCAKAPSGTPCLNPDDCANGGCAVVNSNTGLPVCN